jgi:hypothetical protein
MSEKVGREPMRHLRIAAGNGIAYGDFCATPGLYPTQPKSSSQPWAATLFEVATLKRHIDSPASRRLDSFSPERRTMEDGPLTPIES